MKLKTILKTVLLAVVTVALVLIAGWYILDRYKIYQGERLFFQQYYEQHKEGNK